jgi:hypothetical protein
VKAKSVVIGLAILCTATGAASACQKTGNPAFQDNFKTADPGWGQPDSIAAFTEQGLVLTPPVAGSAWRSNSHLSMAKGDWCVSVISPKSLPDTADENSLGSVGVWFWGNDLQNFYTATITLDGKAQVDRLTHGIWQVVMAPKPAPSIKTAPGATNEIEIVTSGNTAAFFVNGTLVANIAGHPPAGGGQPGIYGESGPQSTSWIFPRVSLY